MSPNSIFLLFYSLIYSINTNKPVKKSQGHLGDTSRKPRLRCPRLELKSRIELVLSQSCYEFFSGRSELVCHLVTVVGTVSDVCSKT